MDTSGAVNGVNGISDGVDAVNGGVEQPPTTTTITTVAVQAGKAKIVLAILKSHDWIRVRIQQMEPDLMEVGATLEEAKVLRREHDELLMKLNNKQRDVTELLARADDLASQNRSYQEVYAAMAASLSEAWIDLNKQLDYRKLLLDQSINFHESALQFSRKMEFAQENFSNVGLANDVETARRLLQQHQDLKKNILEASMSTLQEGQLLLERIREMGVHADVQNRHATTAACYGIEHLLELLQDRRRHLEELWLQRRIRLEQCLQMLLLDHEVNKVSDWYEHVGDVYLSKTDLGSSLAMTNALRDDHQRFEQQAREVQETVLRLIRTADQLVHGARADAESVRKRLQMVDAKCEDFMNRLDARRKNLTMARNFYTLAQTALTRLDEIEVQLATTDLPRNSAALADRHAYLSAQIIEATAPALREGQALLERVGREDPGAQGVVSTLAELQGRCAKLEGQCKARHEATERSQAISQFMDKFNYLNSWMIQVGLATVGQNVDMGANLSTARDFLELHERLSEDMKAKTAEVNALVTTAAELSKSGDAEAVAVNEKVKTFREQWDALQAAVQGRSKLALSYVVFHKKAQQLAIQMDVLEEYLKIEKLDATEVPDSAIKHKEDSFGKMSSEYSEVENRGKQFIKEAQEVKVDEKLDTRRAVVVVETILSHFNERKYLITDYYEHWKVHVVTGKEFKTQWQQIIQDARKTIDWMVKEEKDLFAPYNAGQLGANFEEAKRLQDKVNRFEPTAKKAQEDVENLLRTAEMLSLKGDTRGQRDQIVNELLRVHTRFQARFNEYKILLKMSVKFFESIDKLDKLIQNTEKEYMSTELPMEPTKAEMMLREHEASRSKIKHLIDFTSEEGEQIVVRVRQQDAEAVARDEVQRVLQMTEERRRLWEKTWEDQKARLERNLQMCQFFFDLRQLHGELDELHRQLNSRRGAYGSSLSTVKLTAQAFRQFEKNVDLIEGKVRNFSNTADTMIRSGRYDSRRLRHEVDEVKRK